MLQISVSPVLKSRIVVSDAWETIARILDGYRRNLASFDKTVELLERAFQNLSLDKREDFFTLLSSRLYSERFDYTKPDRTPHEVIVRAWARFGPAAQLPNALFSLLSWNDADGMESWSRKIAREFAHSLWVFRERFPKHALDAIKAQCALFTYEDTSGLVGSRFPQSLIEAARRLERIAEQIEFERFEQTLPVAEVGRKKGKDDLRGLLCSHGLDLQIAEALEKTREYLQIDSPFDAKIAGDLLRTSIDVLHRALVGEVEKLTGRGYQGKDKDGDRRAYLRDTGFISTREEKLFSSIYTFLSEEATHRFDTSKDALLVLERTIADYLHLLLRRLSDLKGKAVP